MPWGRNMNYISNNWSIRSTINSGIAIWKHVKKKYANKFPKLIYKYTFYKGFSAPSIYVNAQISNSRVPEHLHLLACVYHKQLEKGMTRSKWWRNKRYFLQSQHIGQLSENNNFAICTPTYVKNLFQTAAFSLLSNASHTNVSKTAFIFILSTKAQKAPNECIQLH